jgi:hypothetical protein
MATTHKGAGVAVCKGDDVQGAGAAMRKGVGAVARRAGGVTSCRGGSAAGQGRRPAGVVVPPSDGATSCRADGAATCKGAGPVGRRHVTASIAVFFACSDSDRRCALSHVLFHSNVRRNKIDACFAHLR